MNESNVQWAAAQSLVSGLRGAGVTHCVVSPGSRSTPLALAFSRHASIDVHVAIDERSAAFMALGIGRATRKPAVVVCTSGSAVAHFHPAVLEADLGRVPLVVLTADRPPELIDVGAGQTIDQQRIFGSSVRWFNSTGVADAASLSSFAVTGVRAASVATGPVPGPVHVNVALREPLVGDEPDARSQDFIAPRIPQVVASLSTTSNDLVATIADRLRATSRGVIVAGWGSGASGGVIASLAKEVGWPLLADPISGARVGANAISCYDALLRSDDFSRSSQPDLVLRFGAPLTSKVTNTWLSNSVEQIVIEPGGSWLDPSRSATLHVSADPSEVAARLSLLFARGGFRTAKPVPTPWLSSWLDAERRARKTIDTLLDADEVLFDGRVARDVFGGLADGTNFLVASSMPIRDLEWFGRPRAGVALHANRGVNGIDGLVSTAVGIALGSCAPTVALLGDLALLHDSNGLLGLAGKHIDLTLVVVDNDGGAIFSFLPQSDACDNAEFEQLFGTPHGLQLDVLMRAYGVEVIIPADANEVSAMVSESVAKGGVRAVLVRTDRQTNIVRHRSIFAAVVDVVSEFRA